jgi:hypothetical protein
MSVIYKYPLIPGQNVALPVGARILSAREQGQDVCVWASVDPDERLPGFEVFAVPTGGDVLESDQFIGTASLLDGSFILHIFARRLQ